MTLDFERTARSDLRRWLIFVVGAGMVILAASGVMSDEPAILRWVFALFGASGALIGGASLWANTTRGCHVDTSTDVLRWWHMGGLPWLNQSEQSDLTRVERIDLRDSSDTTEFVVHEPGADPKIINLEAVPRDHLAWLAKLVERYPHIATNLDD